MLLLAFVLTSSVSPVVIEAFVTVKLQVEIFVAVAVPVVVADLTVVEPALVAVITLVPLDATAVIVLPLTVNTLVSLDEYVTVVLGVPFPLPFVVESAAVDPYSTVLGFIVKESVLVYF